MVLNSMKKIENELGKENDNMNLKKKKKHNNNNRNSYRKASTRR